MMRVTLYTDKNQPNVVQVFPSIQALQVFNQLMEMGYSAGISYAGAEIS